VTLNVELVQPEGELWAGEASLVVARTHDGEIGVMTGHTPVIGILYEGSLVQIREDDPAKPDVFAAVSGGFLSVSGNRVSVLAREAVLGSEVDTAAAQAGLAGAQAAHASAGPEDPPQVRYYQAQLAAAEQGR
jgi:F-type H+-transporting ATPase subunit epsilon